MNVNFSRRPGVPGPPISGLLVIFFFFFQFDRPTQYQETHSTLNEKKGGMALTTNYTKYEGRFSLAIPNFARALLKAYITT